MDGWEFTTVHGSGDAFTLESSFLDLDRDTLLQLARNHGGHFETRLDAGQPRAPIQNSFILAVGMVLPVEELENGVSFYLAITSKTRSS